MKEIIVRLITYPIVYILWGGLMWYSQIITPLDFTYYLHYIPLCNAKFYNILQTSPFIIIEFFRIIYLYLFTFCIVGGIGYYLIIKRDYLKSDIILVDIAFGWLIAGLIYTFFVVQSPFQVGVAHDLVNDNLLWICTKPTYEIPSLHTAYSVLMALHFKDEKSKIRYFFYALGILIPISTLFMGQHWIIDVITGIIFAYILYRLPKNIHLKIHNVLNYLSGYYDIIKK
ncbi:phosphatase PAP2 family protein [Methanothermococcus sp.]|uniref:phosphatase PAP2 family protein n=1 Tax=Methanothermococcus sp. TaxID=2614238 RepID=UPI0025D66127|nr:phosphatase PAP2 family protein [Methanothermococcus sp.]